MLFVLPDNLDVLLQTSFVDLYSDSVGLKFRFYDLDGDNFEVRQLP